MRLAWVAWLALCLAHGACAQSLCSPPAGLVRIEVPAHSSVPVSFPFVALDEDASLDTLLAGQLTGAPTEDQADRVIFWNAAAQEYLHAYKYRFTLDASVVSVPSVVPSPEADGRFFLNFTECQPCTVALGPGTAFALESRQAQPQSVFLAGSVPLDPARAIVLWPALNLFGYPHLAPAPLNETTLRQSGAQGARTAEAADRVSDPRLDRAWWLLDEPEAQQDGQWLDADGQPTDAKLLPGLGYWYFRNATNAFAWTEPRPYPAELFPTEDGLPRITALRAAADGGAALLTIAPSGSAGARLDVYYQHLAAGSAFAPTGRWEAAVLDLDAAGKSTVECSDPLPADPVEAEGPVRYARVYVAGAAELDTDGDGLPDCREMFLLRTDRSKPDTDGDGMPDGWEAGRGLNPCDPADGPADADGDGVSNALECARGTDPQDPSSHSITIYVDAALGNDANDGLAAVLEGANGPKRTIGAALVSALSQDVVQVAAGDYFEREVRLEGRTIHLKPKGDVHLWPR